MGIKPWSPILGWNISRGALTRTWRFKPTYRKLFEFENYWTNLRQVSQEICAEVSFSRKIMCENQYFQGVLWLPHKRGYILEEVSFLLAIEQKSWQRTKRGGEKIFLTSRSLSFVFQSYQMIVSLSSMSTFKKLTMFCIRLIVWALEEKEACWPWIKSFQIKRGTNQIVLGNASCPELQKGALSHHYQLLCPSRVVWDYVLSGPFISSVFNLPFNTRVNVKPGHWSNLWKQILYLAGNR